jgi:hypothetical protein
MSEAEPSRSAIVQYGASFGAREIPAHCQPRPPKRKYYPRASQACDLCRVKKAKVVVCDQRLFCRISNVYSATRDGHAKFVKVRSVRPHLFAAHLSHYRSGSSLYLQS